MNPVNPVVQSLILDTLMENKSQSDPHDKICLRNSSSGSAKGVSDEGVRYCSKDHCGQERQPQEHWQQ